jgi:hypothetical protein
MPEFKINKRQIPLWKGANGDLVLNVNLPDLNAALAPGASPIVDTRFDVDGGKDIALGGESSLKIGVQAGARARIAPVFQENLGRAADLVQKYDLAGSLTPTNLLLVFEMGGDANVSAEGSFRYSVLSPTATLKAGVDAAYLMTRSFPRATALQPMLLQLLGDLELPAKLTTPPAENELISFEYGGYLNFGVGASAGYEIKGTKSFKISELALSEHYALSVIGKLAFTGQIAGRFSVEVRQGSEPGWAHVAVRRRRSKELRFAADVNVKADLKTDGPNSGKEFLGALLGVEGKNWLNMIDGFVTEAGNVDSIEALKAKLDGLAQDFIGTWVGKAVDDLLPAEVLELQGKVKKVVDSYRNLDQSAIALFDRYFDPIANLVDSQVTARLEELKALTSWDKLKGEVDPLLWNLVRRLTKGDPLGWALGFIPGTNIKSLDALHKRVDDILSLIRDDTHAEIREIIRIAKQQFPLDGFLNQLATVSTPEGLKSVANQKLGHFAERLIGDALDKLNGKDLKSAFDAVKKVVAARDKFFDTFDRILKEAAAQSFALNLHAAYNSADERAAMVDIEIKLREANGSANVVGQRFMEAAGRGDFQEVLANFQPAVVKLREGLLTHKMTRETSLKFNVAGWHKNFSYESMHRVIVNTEQQIRSSGNGVLTVFTSVDMTAESERRKNRNSKSEEAVMTNFLLRFLAESKSVLSDSNFDKKNQLYALDVITGMSAQYNVTFIDKDTSAQELDDYLEFARQLELDRVGATREGLAPILENKNGSFGSVESKYEVRYTEAGIRKLIDLRITDTKIKQILRKIILSNYYSHPTLDDVGWLYGSDDVRKLFDRDPIGFVNTQSVLGGASVSLSSPIPGIQPPSQFSNTFVIRNDVAVLFRIENRIVDAFTALSKLLQSESRIRTSDLEEKLKDFGEALNAFDGFDMGENSIFAVFDGLIQLASSAREARASSLTFKSTKEGTEATKVFTLQAVASTTAPGAIAAGSG